MTERRPPPAAQPQQPNSIRLLQINLNKSERAHLAIINERVSQNYDIILIEEPYTTTFNAIRTPTNFRQIYPSHRTHEQDQIRSVIWVNRKLDTKNWKAIDVPGTGDITAVQLFFFQAHTARSLSSTYTMTVLTLGTKRHSEDLRV
jgi:hypothetical protein